MPGIVMGSGCDVLVTGAAGFAGRHLVQALRGRGARVHGLGREPGSDQFQDDPHAWFAADLDDEPALRRACAASRAGYVFHLAGQSSAARSFESPQATFRVNAGGTRRLLAAAFAANPDARVLVVGSSEAYGPCPHGTRVPETAPFAPVSPYGLSKALADRIAEAWPIPGSGGVVRARSFGHTGPGQAEMFAVPSFIRQIARMERGECDPVLRVGNLEVVRDITDVRDVVHAYIALMERGRSGAAYNVCRGTGVLLSDLVTNLVGRARVPVRVEVDAARLRPADVPHLVGDPGAIARDTGWRAKRELSSTIDDMLALWRGRE